MTLFGSLFAGVAGLSAQSKAMGIISDNVANATTTGYKGSRAEFATLVTEPGSPSRYAPGGVQALRGQLVNMQGMIQGTSSATDAAISGAGFFVVNTKADGTGERLYTRAGALTPDSLGNLRTPSGLFVQGWALGADEQIADINNPVTVNVAGIGGAAVATTTVTLGANLDADEPAFAGAYAAGDMATYAATGGAGGVKPGFVRPVQVYDSLGRAHDLSLAFIRAGAANTWQVEAYAAPGEVDPAVHPDGLVASGTVTFGGDGRLAGVALNPVAAGAEPGSAGITWNPAGGAGASSVALDLGTVGQTDGLTQLSSPTDVSFVDQNGSPAGPVNGMSIDDEGYVVGSFTNGQQRRLFRLPLATFGDPTMLAARSGNVFGETTASGLPNLRVPGTGGAGTVTPSALEGANIDLADEFTRMIVTQRAYSANARIISTTDQMLSELLEMRR